MATIKSYSDLQQSKKLAEILPLESADMFWRHCNLDNLDYPIMQTEFEYIRNANTPCWSLASLLNVLPDTITNNNGIAFKLNIKKNIIEYSNPSLYLIHKFVKSDNLIDACVEMIIKLNELKML